MGPQQLTFAISHRTVLHYSATVHASYNEVRMYPRHRGGQRVLAFALTSAPAAAPRSRVDFYGNVVHRVDVAAPHQLLELTMQSVVAAASPQRHVPEAWSQRTLQRDPNLEFAQSSPRVPLEKATAELLHAWVGSDRSFDALGELARRIPTEFRYVTGATTVDSSIGDLLDGGAGVCQDFTHLFCALARHAGWPARYVSGYLGPKPEEDEVVGESHAWAEVCGSDGRWVGLDPTQGGLADADGAHIRLAVGRDYGDVAPHRGLYFGGASGSPPEVSVRVARMSAQDVIAAHRGGPMERQQQQQQQ
ncbi:MAG TPA: transglutaminase family protein [Candidatus Dormibacteraeota bacterium]|jgi:transglutaminase-like putative cysteine protease|nr:transglutaminase family protein [Candidatus Dormibacteraeota bacterium]